MNINIDVIESLVEYSKNLLSGLKNWPDNKFHLATLKNDVDDIYNENVEEVRFLKDTVERLNLIEKENKEKPFTFNDTLVKRVADDLRLILEKLPPLYEKYKVYKYKDFFTGGEYYKIKTAFYDEINYDRYLRYLIATFHSEQEMKAMLSNIQKGNKTNRIDWNRDVTTFKNSYKCIYSRVKNENKGDGVHAIIYHENDSIIKVYPDESEVDKVYKYISTNYKTGMIPEWKEFFYNELINRNLIRECEGFDYTGKAPKIFVASKELTTEEIMQIKKEGFDRGELVLPVENTVEFEEDATFFDLVTKYVIPYIKEEEVHYKIGDDINKVISSRVDLGNGKTSKLYPRQQVIAQGLYNAIDSGKKRLILNGSMGIGKTFIGGKLALALAKKKDKDFNFRMAIYCQGQLTKKWERELKQMARPLGVEPIIREVENFKEVKNLPKKPQGFEVLLLPKDRVKRSYQVEMGARDKYNRKSLQWVANFVKEIDTSKDIIFEEAKGIPLRTIKWTAMYIVRKFGKPAFIFKRQLDSEGNVISYKVAVSSKMIRATNKITNRSYHYEIPVEEWKEFVENVSKNKDRLIHEAEGQSYRLTGFKNGLTCPSCGGFIYPSETYLFDEEKSQENLTSKPKRKSKSYGKCNHFVKADGTPLTKEEIKLIKRDEIKVSEVDDTVTVPYVDLDGNEFEDKEIRQIKANRFDGSYKINIRKCNEELWTAYEKKGYRVYNSIELMKKHFGTGYIDFLIADESHIYNRESNQGQTYHTLVEISDAVLNLTGTLTGGKASDIFYTLYRLYPQKMKELGYKYNDINLFIDHYGRKERETKENLDSKYNGSGKGRRRVGAWKERAGISPLLYTNFLSGIMVSRSIEDMKLPMPKLTYYKHEVNMDEEIESGYDNLKDQLLNFMNENKHLPIGGSYIHSLLAYPDKPEQPPIYWSDTDMLIANPRDLNIKDKILPKEKKLIETIKSELAQDRKVLVYSIYSGTKGVSERLVEVLSRKNIKVVELKSSVPVNKREEWIAKKDKEGYDVILTNPVNVSTGLNIIQYPTIYFYECGYDIKILRQAERRAWRVNQPKPCKIYYSYYKESIQEDAMKIIASKKKASLAVEGVFSEDILSSMSDIDDNGAKMLFDVLKGKIELKENELDAFDFADEELVDPEEVIEEKETSDIVEKPIQMDLYTLTKEDLDKRKKKKNNVAEGQVCFFAM